MSDKSVGSVSNRLGLYTVTIWQIRRWFLRRYVFDCDTCGIVSTRYRESAEARRRAQSHADLHQAAINTQLQLPWPPQAKADRLLRSEPPTFTDEPVPGRPCVVRPVLSKPVRWDPETGAVEWDDEERQR